MKNLLGGSLVITVVVCLAGCGGEQEKRQAEQAPRIEQPAKPEITMADYYFGIIRKGKSWTAEETAAITELQNQHLARINHLADSGALVLAGPFVEEEGNDDLRGIVVYDVDSMAQARALADSDPGVQAGRLKIDLFAWQAPAELAYDEEYEMTKYYMVFYFRGPWWDVNNPPKFKDMQIVQADSLAHVCDTCRVVLGGEFTDPYNDYGLLGVIIYHTLSSVETEQIISASYPVRANEYMIRLFGWYGPSGLRIGQ